VLKIPFLYDAMKTVWNPIAFRNVCDASVRLQSSVTRKTNEDMFSDFSIHHQ
jgi:hypothetical protein